MEIKTQIITFISGKGGSGKTSIALSISQILAILKHRILLVDLDTATHGASYFFNAEKTGLEEWLEKQKFDNGNSLLSLKDCVRTVGNPYFEFLPSKTKFEKSNWESDVVVKEAATIIKSLDDLIKSEKYEYVIFDCQAGVNVLTAHILKISSYAVIVTEADAVSTKALKNLQYQFGELFSKISNKIIINKLFLKETTSYKTLISELRDIDFLPPIPFDMDIRQAFAQNIIPLQENHFTAYFSSILRILKELLPGVISQEIDEKLKELNNVQFANYNKKLDELESKKDELIFKRKKIIGEIEKRKNYINEFKIRFIPGTIMLVSFVPFILKYFSRSDFFYFFRIEISIAIIGVVTSYLWIVWNIYSSRGIKSIAKKENQVSEIEKELKRLDVEIDKYQTLYVTERQEYFSVI